MFSFFGLYFYVAEQRSAPAHVAWESLLHFAVYLHNSILFRSQNGVESCHSQLRYETYIVPLTVLDSDAEKNYTNKMQ